MMKWVLMIPVFALVLLYMFLQALLYTTRVHTLPTSTGLRFLHLTDIHISLLLISAGRIRKTIENTRPDYILISGDILSKPDDLKKFVRWFEKINPGTPVFSVLGNHEHRCFRKNPGFKNEFLSAMKALDIRVLCNEVVFLPGKREKNSGCSSKTIALAGFDDYKAGQVVNNQIFQGLRERSDSIFAFSHNPDIALHIPEGSVDLLITGHFHGGQIWLPFKLEYLFLRKDIVSKMGYIKDFATIRGNRVYISRGLGTVLFTFRFLSVPEVTIFDT
jgi:predicted MPP superfamily phosphohydrolase